jgi:hypothetical protein
VRREKQMRRHLLRRTVVLVLAIGAVLVLAAYPALGDPLNGHNSTPGTLTCGGVTHPTTSGSGPANAIQLADGSGVFVVKEIPLFGFVHGGGIPEGNLQTCVLSEPSIPESPITVIGILTSAG